MVTLPPWANPELRNDSGREEDRSIPIIKMQEMKHLRREKIGCEV